jgi:quercetin dioxygenase-like cupin family protein
MAYKNKIISNKTTGQSIRFLQTAKDTNGKLLEMETTYEPGSKEPAAHYHPNQEEIFTVISGELTVRINKEIKKLTAGDVLHFPKNTVHSMWNGSDGVTVVNWKVLPAFDTEYFLETAMGIAADGKINEKGMPPFFQTVMLADRYSPEFRLAKPPYAIQKIIFNLLKPIGYLLGYRAVYKKYLN